MWYLDLTNKQFNNLTVIRQIRSTRKGQRFWECKCICGNVKTYSTDHLTRKKQPVKSCGCKKRSHGSSHKDWTGYGEISGNWWSSHVTREKKQKVRTKVPVTVTIKEGWELFLKQDRRCALSGLELKFGSNSINNTASLDRIDSSKGYEINNIQWVHKHINFMKRDYDQNYFIDLCKKVVNNVKTR